MKVWSFLFPDDHSRLTSARVAADDKKEATQLLSRWMRGLEHDPFDDVGDDHRMIVVIIAVQDVEKGVIFTRAREKTSAVF